MNISLSHAYWNMFCWFKDVEGCLKNAYKLGNVKIYYWRSSKASIYKSVESAPRWSKDTSQEVNSQNQGNTMKKTLNFDLMLLFFDALALYLFIIFGLSKSKIVLE